MSPEPADFWRRAQDSLSAAEMLAAIATVRAALPPEA